MMIRNKIGLALAVFLCCGILAGCIDIDKSYVAEKLLWQADQSVNKLFLKAKKENRQLTKEEVGEMIAAYRRVSERFPLEPKVVRAQTSIADIYARTQRFDEARAELKRVIQNFSVPDIASRAQAQIAETFLLEGKFSQAVEAYDTLIDLYPLSPLGMRTPLFVIGLYQNRKDAEGAQKAYRRAVRHYEKLVNEFEGTPYVGLYHSYVALAHLQAKEWNSALQVFDAIIASYPDSPFALQASVSKAELYLTNLNDKTKGIQLYEDFVAKYPQSPLAKQARLRLGGLYFAAGDHEKAKETFDELIKEYPDDKEMVIRSYFGLAAYYEETGKEKELLGAYETVRKKFPDDPRCLSIPLLMYKYYNEKAGEELKAKKVLREGMEEYEAAFERHKNNQGLQQTIAQSLFFFYSQAKEWQRLLAFLQRLQALHPDDPRFSLSIANLYRNELGQPQKAREVFEAMLKQYAANEQLVAAIRQQMNNAPAARQ